MLTLMLATAVLAGPPALEVKVDGEGYLRFVREGRVGYAKAASFKVSAGRIVDAGGDVLLPMVTVPEGAAALDVDLQGEIFAVMQQGRSDLGRIVLALFPDGSALSPESGLLVSRDRPTLGNPGEGTAGVIRVARAVHVEPAKANVGPQPLIHAAQAQQPTHAARHPGTIEIDVQADSEIEAEEVLLGDIARIDADKATAQKLAAVDIGPTPLIGVQIPLDVLRITTHLRAAQIDPAKFVIDVPRGAFYARKAGHVTQQQFIDCAIAFAKTQADPGMDFSCKEENPDFLAPLGQLDLKVEQYSPTLNGACVVVGVYVDGKRQNGRSLRLDITGFNNKPLIRVPAMTRVTILVRCNGATVETTGKTIRASIVGQTVDVQTEDRSIHTGTLTGPGTVEVKL